MNLHGLELVARDYDPATDVGFVGARWGSECFAQPPGLYRDAVRRAVDHLIAECRIAVVCSATSPATLHGFAAVDRDTGALAYAYVLPKLRGNGLGKLAITAAIGDYPARIPCARPWPNSNPRFAGA